MKFTESLPAVEAYNALRLSSGIGNAKAPAQVRRALAGSLYVISGYDGEKLVAMGRIVGDGGITYGIADVMVDRAYQGKGLGEEIVSRIDDWLDANTDGECFIMLLANAGADRFYARHGFRYVDPKMVGMLRT